MYRSPHAVLGKGNITFPQHTLYLLCTYTHLRVYNEAYTNTFFLFFSTYTHLRVYNEAYTNIIFCELCEASNLIHLIYSSALLF